MMAEALDAQTLISAKKLIELLEKERLTGNGMLSALDIAKAVVIANFGKFPRRDD